MGSASERAAAAVARTRKAQAGVALPALCSAGSWRGPAGILQEGDHGGTLRPPGALANAVGIEGRRGSQSDRVCVSPGTPSEMGWRGGAMSSRGTETPASAALGTLGEAQILDAVGLSRRGSIVAAERGAGGLDAASARQARAFA